jgi:hypothetical protein
MNTSATPTSSRAPEPGDFSPPYFAHVLAEYELLRADGDVPAKIRQIVDKKENDPPTPGDLYLLEKYVIYKQPEPVVRARLSGLRLSYRDIVGTNAYAQYLESGQASQTSSSLETVRADAGRLLDALHWAYAMVPACEQTRTDILRKIVQEMFVSVGIGLVVLLAAFFMGQTMVAAIVLVMLMGALGGFLSVQQRIAKISTDQDPILTMFQLQKGLFAVRLAPLTGALCALVLLLIFQADLLTGALFPDMKKLLFRLGTLQTPTGVFTGGDNAIQFAKLLVWCFIAGFAERFVPDTLNKLVSKQEQPEAGRTEIARIPQPLEIGKATEAEKALEAAKAAAAAAARASTKQAGATGSTEHKDAAAIQTSSGASPVVAMPAPTIAATTKDQPPPPGDSPEKPDGKPALEKKIS